MPKRTGSQLEMNSKKLKVEVTESDTSERLLKKKSKDLNDSVWSNDEILGLLSKIEENIPENDSLSYTTRLGKLNWETIKYKSYSTLECKKNFTVLYKQVRKFRLLREIVDDMKTLASNTSFTNTSIQSKKPKKPPSSFLIFAQRYRQKLAAENKTIPFIEMSRVLSQEYKKLTPEERAEYEKLAKVELEKYTKTMQNFYDEHPELIPKKSGRNSKTLEFAEGQGPPMKPKTPFDLFVQMERDKEETQTESKIHFMRRCKEAWRNFTDEEKYFWINWADELHTKYMEDIKEYLEKHPTYKPEYPKTILSKLEKKIKEKCSGKPEKPPHGPYHLFCKLILESEEVRKIDTKECMNYVAEKWRNCSQEEKNEYKLRVEQMWEDYHNKLEEYFSTFPPEDRDMIRSEEKRKNRTEKIIPKSSNKLETTTPIKPLCPPSTAKKYFLKNYPGSKPKRAWKKLSKEEKDEWEAKLSKEKTKFISLYEAYLKSLSREELEKFATQTNSSSDLECDDTN